MGQIGKGLGPGEATTNVTGENLVNTVHCLFFETYTRTPTPNMGANTTLVWVNVAIKSGIVISKNGYMRGMRVIGEDSILLKPKQLLSRNYCARDISGKYGTGVGLGMDGIFTNLKGRSQKVITRGRKEGIQRSPLRGVLRLMLLSKGSPILTY